MLDSLFWFLSVSGSQQFSSYFGYRDTFEWSGPHEDYTQRYSPSPLYTDLIVNSYKGHKYFYCFQLNRDEWERRQRQILAIDARFYKHSREQYNMSEVIRELNKVKFPSGLINPPVCQNFGSSQAHDEICKLLETLCFKSNTSSSLDFLKWWGHHTGMTCLIGGPQTLRSTHSPGPNRPWEGRGCVEHEALKRQQLNQSVSDKLEPEFSEGLFTQERF